MCAQQISLKQEETVRLLDRGQKYAKSASGLNIIFPSNRSRLLTNIKY